MNHLANAIRFLSANAIQKANSGHPGLPLGMADVATVLWREFLQHCPASPKWLNRDRFVLSNGHGSMMLYSLLHLTGYDVAIEDLKQFRQLHSRTPGHPEYNHLPGVETTTGPLGQGLANAVGMALAEKVLSAQFNRPQYEIINHYTYAFVGDGCLMEGLSHEACSLAGTWGLGKLIVFWDNNGISIDGKVERWFTDDTPQRFAAYNWQVLRVDGHDVKAIREAIIAAQKVTDKPSLICCKTTIGFGAPNLCGKHECHGAPLGAAELALMRKNLNWNYEPFVIPDEIYQQWDARGEGALLKDNWDKLFNAYQKAFPDLAKGLLRRVNSALPSNWADLAQNHAKKIVNKINELATRKASQNCLEALGPVLPELIGGGADLAPSNLTMWSKSKAITRDDVLGNYIHYGVREFAMCAIMNGLTLHGGFIPYGGTFLVFADYCKNAIRMAAMMQLKVIYVLTHDSIGVGEDGPTHQPIEQLAMLRTIPGLSVWRPCDEIETWIAWQMAIERQGPTALALTRQKTHFEQRTEAMLANIKLGGYVLIDCENFDTIIIATGSEVKLAVTVAQKLNALGKKIRVVSMPSVDVFEKQDAAYQEMVLPDRIEKRLAIEAGVTSGWYKFVGLKGKVLGIDRFGISAPEQQVFAEFGFTEEGVEKIINNEQ